MTREPITGYPANLVVEGRRCVVVGAGRIAARKIEALLAAGAGRARGRARGRRRRARAGPTPGGSRSTSGRSTPPTSTAPGSPPTATGVPAVDHAVFEAGEARRVWVNSADDPANCSFTLMSVVRRGDVVVTIGTGGRSPALATWLAAVRRRARPRVRGPARPALRRPGGPPRRGPLERGSWLATGARFRHARSRPCRPHRRGEGAARGMSLLVVGLNHRTVPVALLERLAVAPDDLPKALQALMRREHLAEAVLLSTCNRTEVYAHATLFHPAMQDVRDFLADQSGVDPDEFSDLLYAYHDDAAVAHLFAVAAGLDSMIIGEGEILGQVREAWRVAERESASSTMLGRTFRHAIEVGKRARTETGIGRHAVSVSSAAVVARDRDSSGRSTTGACSCSARARWARAWRSRSRARACARSSSPTAPCRAREELADRVGGRAIPLDAVSDALVECDVVLVSTGASDVLVERAAVEAVMTRARRAGAARRRHRRAAQHRPRRGRGVRRDAARHRRPAGVRRAVARATAPGDRPGPRPHRRRARPPPPRPQRAGGRAARAPRCASTPRTLRVGELARSRALLESLEPSQREAVEALTQAFVNKLLHEPTVRLKDAAGIRARRARTPTRSSSCSGCRSPSPTPTNDGAPVAAAWSSPMTVRIATRGTPLARWQAERIASLLGGRHRAGRRHHHAATRAPTRRSTTIGGTGVFVKEVEQALLDGRRRPRGALRQGPPVAAAARRPRARRVPRARRRARRAGRQHARRRSSRARPSPPARCAAAPSSPRCTRRSSSPSCAAASRPGSRRPPTSTRSSWPPRRSSGSGCSTAPTSCCDRR